jgi:hypothetical protein
MNGNFEKELILIWDGKGVAARGPLEWEDEDRSMSLHVAILQEGVTAVGRTGDDIPKGATEFLVAAAVEGGGALKAGHAAASGWAFVHGNGIEMYEWTVPVKLVAGTGSSARGSSSGSAARSPGRPSPKSAAEEMSGDLTGQATGKKEGSGKEEEAADKTR